MAIKFIETTGKTDEEAVQNALKQLGLTRDEVSVELLERARSGFLGIGAKPARVRVSYGIEEEPVPQTKKEAKPQKSEEKPAPRQEKRREPQKEKPARESRPNREEKPAPREEKPLMPAEPVEELGEPCNDETAQKIRTFLEGLLQHMEHSATVQVYHPAEDRYKVILEGEKLGQLIGRRGETLDAIQQLTNYSVNRGAEHRARIHVDAENYRQKREESLYRLAHKVAAKVVKNHRNVTLEPMNAYERHVIHTALQDMEGVTTYSMGTEPNRRVIVAFQR